MLVVEGEKYWPYGRLTYLLAKYIFVIGGTVFFSELFLFLWGWVVSLIGLFVVLWVLSVIWYLWEWRHFIPLTASNVDY